MLLYKREKLILFLELILKLLTLFPLIKKENLTPSSIYFDKEQLDYLHDIEYWKNIILKSRNSEIVSIYEMESNEECWEDWINCDNEYSKSDRKSIEAGACKYLNFIAIVLKKI